MESDSVMVMASWRQTRDSIAEGEICSLKNRIEGLKTGRLTGVW